VLGMLLKCIDKCKRVIKTLCVFGLLFFSQLSIAHVKWFAPYDVASEPKNIFDVLTPFFCSLMLGSVVIVFFIAWFDRSKLSVVFDQHIGNYRQTLQERLPENFSPKAIRYTLLVFFVCIWSIGGIILTPELTYENSTFIGLLHVAIIVCLFTAKSARYSGVGILALWLYSAYHYGIFHLSDYIIFLGLGLFVIYASFNSSEMTRKGFLLLYIAISITLQWASIEKFVYPQWSFPIIEERPYLSMGMHESHFMMLAGFVEFAFAFLIVSVSGVGFIIATIGLATIFMLAIIDFGKIDAIGHMAIIGSLLVMSLNGPTKINLRFASMHPNAVYNACLITLVYCVSITLFFALYYGVRHLWLLSI
jgi:hypothetical protein